MTSKIRVNKQFLDDFELVTKHYKCPVDEIELLRNKARESYGDISKSIAIIAGNIRNGCCN